MSRTYAYKPDFKKKTRQRDQLDKRVVLADYEIEFIEMSLGSQVRLNV